MTGPEKMPKAGNGKEAERGQTYEELLIGAPVWGEDEPERREAYEKKLIDKPGRDDKFRTERGQTYEEILIGAPVWGEDY